MTWNIIGCGETAMHWDGHGLAIGVNDAEKIGHHVSALVLMNTPDEFMGERLDTILQTKAKICLSDNVDFMWHRLFGVDRCTTLHPFRRWGGQLKMSPPIIYHSDTSPFVAMTLAFRWGASELVLWGVDFRDHHIYKPGNIHFNSEIERYHKLAFQLKKAGCNVYLGCKGSNLDLPVKPR